MDKPTEKQLHIIRHSLGLSDDGSGTDYRNHFITDPKDSDGVECEALVALGLMVSHAPREIFGGGTCYQVTKEGRIAEAALRPPPKKITRSQKRYVAFLHHDSGWTFGEWLKNKGYRRV